MRFYGILSKFKSALYFAISFHFISDGFCVENYSSDAQNPLNAMIFIVK